MFYLERNERNQHPAILGEVEGGREGGREGERREGGREEREGGEGRR